MALSNLNNVHLSTTKTADALDALLQLENALTAITINLSSEDRQRYGSVNEQNKLFVNRYMITTKTNLNYKMRK